MLMCFVTYEAFPRNAITEVTAANQLNVAALEYVYVSRRSIIGNVSMAVGLAVGGAVEPWILKALGDWKLLMPVLFAQGAVVFITPWQV